MSIDSVNPSFDDDDSVASCPSGTASSGEPGLPSSETCISLFFISPAVLVSGLGKLWFEPDSETRGDVWGLS